MGTKTKGLKSVQARTVKKRKRPDDYTEEDLCFVCERLNKEILGKKRSWSYDSAEEAMSRVLALCEDHEVDPGVYLEAQFRTLKKTLLAKNIPLYPKMLLGQNAMKRYNDYVRRTRKSHGSAAGRSKQVVDDALRADFMFAEIYILPIINGFKFDFKTAVKIVKEKYRTWSPDREGDERVLQFTLDRIKPGLSQRVYVKGKTWTWEGLLQFIVEICN